MASKFNFGKRLCVTGHEYRKTVYGAAMRWGCSCENRFLSKRWHPSFNRMSNCWAHSTVNVGNLKKMPSLIVSHGNSSEYQSKHPKIPRWEKYSISKFTVVIKLSPYALAILENWPLSGPVSPRRSILRSELPPSRPQPLTPGANGRRAPQVRCKLNA